MQGKKQARSIYGGAQKKELRLANNRQGIGTCFASSRLKTSQMVPRGHPFEAHKEQQYVSRFTRKDTQRNILKFGPWFEVQHSQG